MESSRKYLKIFSILVLLFAALSLVSLISGIFFGGLNNADVPEGSPENTLLITQIFVLVVSLIMLLPQLYMGLKGLKVAKNPDSSKGHIVWAIILFVISVLGLISPITAIIKLEDVWSNVSSLCNIIVELWIFFEYIRHARAVSISK